MKKIDAAAIRRILIIKPRAIGDVILTTPFIRALKKNMPQAKIDFMIEPFAAPVIEGNPNINKIILMHRHKNPAKELAAVRNMRKNELKKQNPFVRMIEAVLFHLKLRAGNYDLVFDLWGNMRTAIAAWLSGAPHRVGFDFRGRKYFYSLAVKRDITPKYNALFQMDLLKAAGIQDDGVRTEIFTSTEDEKFAESFFSDFAGKAPFIGINALGSWPAKRWPAEKFAETAGLFVRRKTGCRIFMIWGPGEKEHALKTVSLMGKAGEKAALIPETSIKQLAALIKRMDIVITNDGGPKHIAAAVGVPTVTVFGPTNYMNWGPQGDPLHGSLSAGVKCSPCEKLECPYGTMECMEKVSAEDVYSAADKILNEVEKNGRD